MKLEIEQSPKRRRIYIEIDRAVDRIIVGLVCAGIIGVAAPEIPDALTQILRHLL